MTGLILDAAKFTPHIGDDFTLTAQETVINAVLAKVVEYPASTAPGAARTAFSLFLCVQHNAFPDIQSGDYAIEHRSLDKIGLAYIERILSPQPDVIRLEVAFN
ncbi:hypothetical protein GOZ97_04335 [Agrobacterium vitis]|uniref:DUF6916 family protein n=1 Tax=Rhizobium/Agrobacterium group TaxID=227290 RepID=UPI0008DC0215|nr:MULTISPECIES: hypothetical protein [Rhizobium/Agrobacterium group]MCF1432626.1 hypothetical protein [Allorhizobium ampelinum]MUO87838.1 hypothetical protein [Agrobacterium vitis]MUZ51033.1 hypothetical protein [Agrobacterium vitis]MUZ90640.1 hypothetical protein [Agrobacterium vitis]MVA38586.1 hypothetical protein [Agrobacterium vitis]